MNRTRRSFLLRAAATAGATWFDVPTLLADTREESLKRFGGYAFGLQAHSLRDFPLEKVVGVMHDELELHWVEFSRAHLPLQPASGGRYAGPAVTLERIEGVKKLLREYDVTCYAHGVNSFTNDAAANRKVFELGRALGVRNLSAGPSEDAFDSLEKLVEEFGIRIAIHNHGPGSKHDKTADLVRAVKDRHPDIGVCLDVGHTLRSGEDPVKAVYELKGRTFGVHFKDVAELKAKAEIVPLGKGQLDVEGVFRALRDIRFPADGAVVLEYEAAPDNPLPSIRECLEVAARAARKAAQA